MAVASPTRPAETPRVQSLNVHIGTHEYVRQPLTPRKLLKLAIKGAMNASTLGLEKGVVMTRYRMYADIRREVQPFVSRLIQARFNAHLSGPYEVLHLSRSDQLREALGLYGIHETIGDYPAFDALNLHQVGDNSVDVLLSDQVLEHVAGEPFRVFTESLRVLRPGGFCIHTTCFNQPIHGGPAGNHPHRLHDYWRYTPQNLARLANRFAHVTTGYAGGHWLWKCGFRYLDVPHASWHPLHKIAMLRNAEDPYVVWVIAQKGH